MPSDQFPTGSANLRSAGTDAKTTHLQADQFISYASYKAPQLSPYSSPALESPAYRPYEQSTSSSNTTPSYAPESGHEHEHNPFSDEIPLRRHSSKADTEAQFPNHLPYDPTVVDASTDARQERRERREKNISLRRIPWVVYIFTFIQCIVFIVELVKNGRYRRTFQPKRMLTSL